MTAPSLISHDPAVVKAELLRMFAALLDPLLEGAQAGRLTPRAAELGAWSVVIPLGAAVLTALLAALARVGRSSDSARRWSAFAGGWTQTSGHREARAALQTAAGRVRGCA